MDWNQLPSEVKEIILRHTTNNTRLALSACSSSDKELVSSVRFKTLKKMHITCELEPKEKYTIEMWKEDEDDLSLCQSFTSFESFQTEVQKILRGYHFIDKLRLHLTNSKIQLLKDKNAQKLKVKQLHIFMENDENMEKVVGQFEHFYLREIHIRLERPNEAVFETPQVMFAEEVHVDGQNTGIREDQLMKLNARVVEIKHMPFSANQYIKKCILQADSNISGFLFTFDDETLIEKTFESLKYIGKKKKKRGGPEYVRTMDTPYPNLKMKVKIDHSKSPVTMIGTVEFDSEKNASLHLARDESMFRVVRNLKLCYDHFKNYKINITRSHQPERFYIFPSQEEAQEKLDDILANTDYVKSFEIDVLNGEYDWELEPREKLLTVGKLEVTSNDEIYQTVQSFSQIIDPEYLKELTIKGDGICPAFLTMPHAINAQTVRIYQTDFSGNQTDGTRRVLNRVLATPIVQAPYPGYYDELQEFMPVTETVLNQYFKRCLLKLNEKDFDFLYMNDYDEIEGILEQFEEEKLLEGLDIISNEWDGASKFIIINSTFENYVYKVEICEDAITAKRVLRDQMLVGLEHEQNSS